MVGKSVAPLVGKGRKAKRRGLRWSLAPTPKEVKARIRLLVPQVIRARETTVGSSVHIPGSSEVFCAGVEENGLGYILFRLVWYLFGIGHRREEMARLLWGAGLSSLTSECREALGLPMDKNEVIPWVWQYHE